MGSAKHPLMMRGAVFLWVFVTAVSSVVFANESDIDSLVHKAEILIDQKAYVAGISVLETVLERDPDHSEAKAELMDAYSHQSDLLIKQGRFSEAQVYLDKMKAFADNSTVIPVSNRSKEIPRVEREVVEAKSFFKDGLAGSVQQLISLHAGREQFNEAVEHYNRQEYDLAEQLLLESLKYDRTNPYTYQLLGHIASLRHDLDQAETYYKKALEMHPDPKIFAQYQKLKREQAIEKTQQQYEDEHFTIRYRRGGPFRGSEIRDALREAYRTVSQDFGYYPKMKLPVILYDREEYFQLMGEVPHWSGAAFDGKIRLPVYENGAGETEMKRLAYHELTHAFVFRFCHAKCPSWLNEGLAVYEENKAVQVDTSILQNAAKKGALIGIGPLTAKDISSSTDISNVYLFYQQSFSMVSKLVSRYRMYKLKEFLTELDKEAVFSEAFEKVFRKSFDRFYLEWQSELIKN